MEEGLLAPENAPEAAPEAAPAAEQPETPTAEAPAPADEPVRVREADHSPGFAIPAPPADLEQPVEQPEEPAAEAAGEAPKLGDLKRATAKGHGLTDGDRAWVADRVGTVRAGTIRKNGSTYTFEPDDHQ